MEHHLVERGEVKAVQNFMFDFKSKSSKTKKLRKNEKQFKKIEENGKKIQNIYIYIAYQNIYIYIAYKIYIYI